MNYQIQKQIPSVNFHLWQPCNMQCKFCFAGFLDVKSTILPKGHLPKEDALRVVRSIGYAGFEKITFAGGEPTLCPWLIDLVSLAKELGMTTMLVTNGSKINDAFLKEYSKILDWIVLSIDSINVETNKHIGRMERSKKAIEKQEYIDLTLKIKNAGYQLKINTVVTRLNYTEDLSELIKSARPERWKIFQVLAIDGQNDRSVESLTVSVEQFNKFLKKHKLLAKYTTVVSEDNSLMKDSYVMIDPAGRFYTNKTGSHVYSQPILDIGLKKAYKSMHYNYENFKNRGGIYNWQNLT
tara:strand:+ start:219 stop:1106 length:888 start_codon:yes stop_codon:yes gene_type:complete